MRTLLQDIRYGVRTLLRKPGFTVAAIVALALGIGANTAIFSFVHGVLLRPLPYPDQDRIQLIFATSVQQNVFNMPLSLPDYLELRNRVPSFDKMAGYLRGISFTLLTPQGAQSFDGAIATADFFDVLGMKPKLGRGFEQADEAPSAPSVVVISERMWRNQFNADPEIAGRIINFTNGPHTVVGVMPAEVQYPRYGIDVWRNFRISPSPGGEAVVWGMGRLRSDASRRQAQEELATVATQLQRSSPLSNSGRGFASQSLADVMLGDLRTPLYILLGAVVFVLLIATANVANLMLARSTARDKEVAIRTALGAGRLRIARQLLTESVVLAGAGGLAGLAIAQWSLDAFVALAPAGIPRINQVTVDSTVLGFTAVISLVCGLLFGMFPALQTKLVDLNSTLKEGGRGTAASGGSSFRRALVVVEIALSLILLTGAGITIRSFLRLRHVETGFDSSNVLSVRMGVNPAKYDSREKTVALYDEVQRRLAMLPGVQVTGITNSLPPIQNDANDSFTIEGRRAGAGDEAPIATVLLVDPGYFKALNIPVLRGRAFLDTDRVNAPRVAMISETLANRHFPNENPVGKRMKIGGAERADMPWMEIVGVVKDVRYDGLKGPVDPAYYMPYAQVPQRGQDIVIKSASDPASLANAVRAEIRAVDTDIPLLRVTTLEERMSQAVGEPRFQTTLLAVFSGIALLLSAIGIYAVISYSITLRTHEIGVRMSLGASRSDVLRMVVREGMVLAGVGGLIGLVGALALTRFMAGLLFEISPRDPLTFATVSGIMLGVAFLACFIPARRATRVDPMIALRYE